MSNTIEVKVPDIGDFKDIPVIEIMVKPGDHVSAEDPLLSLESDKATLEVPAPSAGTVKELRIKVGDKASKGTLILMLDADAADAADAPAATTAIPAAAPAVAPATGQVSNDSSTGAQRTPGRCRALRRPERRHPR